MTPKGSRALGVDLGTKRVGLSIGDKALKIATGYRVIEYKNREKLVEDLREITLNEDVGIIVIGLPVNMDGSEGIKAREARNISELIKSRLNVDVILMDERLSTAEAIRRLHATNQKAGSNRERIDMMAATIILQDYLDTP